MAKWDHHLRALARQRPRKEAGQRLQFVRRKRPHTGAKLFSSLGAERRQAAFGIRDTIADASLGMR